MVPNAMRLLDGSPAIDVGANTMSLNADQRGIPRPLNASNSSTVRADIGAVEKYYGMISGIHYEDLNTNGTRDENGQPCPTGWCM